MNDDHSTSILTTSHISNFWEEKGVKEFWLSLMDLVKYSIFLSTSGNVKLKHINILISSPPL